MPFDVARARRETPGCQHVIHFNNAGAALVPEAVLRAQIEHLEREAREGGYEAARMASAKVERTYHAVAALLGADPDEIALVENATVGWSLAFRGLRFSPGDRILTAEAEYGSNFLAYLKATRDLGVRVEVIPSDADGALDVDALEAMIDDRVKLVSISHIPTNGGLINPAEAVGLVARRAGIPYLLDACQSCGQRPVDVQKIGCDMLSGTGRKYLRGPRGSGFLYVRRGFLDQLDPPMIDVRSADWTAPDQYILRPDARRFENWECNVAARIGLGVAVDHALGWGLDAIEARITILAEHLRARLAGIPGVTVRDLGARRCGIVSFTVEGRDAAEVKAALAAKKINVSVSDRSSTRLDMTRRGLSQIVRASVHYYNTEDEIERLVEALAGA